MEAGRKDVMRAAGVSGQAAETEETYDSVDFYKLYLDELKAVAPAAPEEEEKLLAALLEGKKEAAGRLAECRLGQAAALAEEYRDRGVSMSDLVQEANMALLLAAHEYAGGDFGRLAETKIRAALEEALSFQEGENRIEEEMAARVNVLKDISAAMARELGREATVAELAERMKLTEDEIKDIMKLAVDALSITGDYVQTPAESLEQGGAEEI